MKNKLNPEMIENSILAIVSTLALVIFFVLVLYIVTGHGHIEEDTIYTKAYINTNEMTKSIEVASYKLGKDYVSITDTEGIHYVVDRENIILVDATDEQHSDITEEFNNDDTTTNE